MEKMDEILSYWADKVEDFPVGIREREETGCCTPQGVYNVAINEPGHA